MIVPESPTTLPAVTSPGSCQLNSLAVEKASRSVRCGCVARQQPVPILPVSVRQLQSNEPREARMRSRPGESRSEPRSRRY